MKKSIENFLKENLLAVLSTVHSGNKPQSALVAYLEEGYVLYFRTMNDTRKVINIENNPHVALVIGFGMKTLQYEGVCSLVAENNEIKRVKALFIAKDSPNKKYLDGEGGVFFKVTPKWIRYSNYSSHPTEIVELDTF